jgi:hypothetical protein
MPIKWPLSKHKSLTDTQKYLKKMLEEEIEKKYQNDLIIWRNSVREFYDRFKKRRIYIAEPPKKMKVPCICDNCSEKTKLNDVQELVDKVYNDYYNSNQI